MPVLDPQVWRDASLISHLQVAYPPGCFGSNHRCGQFVSRVRIGVFPHIPVHTRSRTHTDTHTCTHTRATHARRHTDGLADGLTDARGNIFLLRLLLIIRGVEAGPKRIGASLKVQVSRSSCFLSLDLDVFFCRAYKRGFAKSNVRWCHCSSATCTNCMEGGSGGSSSSCSKCYVILVRRKQRLVPEALLLSAACTALTGVLGTWWRWCKGKKALKMGLTSDTGWWFCLSSVSSEVCFSPAVVYAYSRQLCGLDVSITFNFYPHFLPCIVPANQNLHETHCMKGRQRQSDQTFAPWTWVQGFFFRRFCRDRSWAERFLW